MSHIWQRFLLTSSLLVGFAVGVAATVFGYSNLASVDVHWSVFHINGIPLWTVALVPVALTIAAGAVYHWIDSLHHFTEHMRHRHRVHELEAELGALRAHLDQVLEMPAHAGTEKAAPKVSLPSPEPAHEDLEPVQAEVALAPVATHSEPEAPVRKSERRKRVRLTVSPQPTAEQANGADATGTDLPAKPNPEA